MSLRASCPQCGGANDLPSGDSIVPCGFCASALAVDRGALVSRYRVGRALDENGARSALRRWMAGDRTATGLENEATVAPGERQVLPFWMLRVAAPGGDRVYVEPAAAVGLVELASLGIPAGQLEARRQEEEGAVELPLAQTAEVARAQIERRFGSGLRFEETSLVDVPLWRFTYRYRGTGYVAYVDGASGAVAAGAYPPKREAPYRWVAGAGLAIFLLEGLAISNVALRLVAFALTCIPLFGLARWATRSR